MEQYKVVNKKGKEIFSPVTLHPGEVLEMELEARGIKKNVFASQLQIQPANLSELLAGKRHVSAATALRLEKLLGINAEYWLRIQMKYDLQTERLKMAA